MLERTNNFAASGFLFLVLAVPAFRNLVEYHAELLYAREQTLERAIVLAVIAALKAALLIAVLNVFTAFQDRALWLNGVFGALWLASAAITYGVMLQRPIRRNKN